MAPRCFPPLCCLIMRSAFLHMSGAYVAGCRRGNAGAGPPPLRRPLQVQHQPQDLVCLLQSLRTTYEYRANKREWSRLWSHSGSFLLPDTTRKVDAAKMWPQVHRVTHFWLLSNTAFIALPQAGAARFLLLLPMRGFRFSHLSV